MNLRIDSWPYWPWSTLNARCRRSGRAPSASASWRGARTARPRPPGRGSPSARSPRRGRCWRDRRARAAGARGRRSRPTRRRSRTARRACSSVSCERAHHVGHERLAEPHVAERVLVGRQAVAAAAVVEGRVDDRDVRQRAGEAVLVVARDRVDPGARAAAEQRGEGQVGGVVARGQAVADRAVEDRLPVVAAGGDRVALQPARLRRPLVEAVRPGRAEQRAEVAVVARVVARRLVDEAEVALVEVGERELVVARAGGEEAAVQLGAARSQPWPGSGCPQPLYWVPPVPSVEKWRVDSCWPNSFV